MSVPDGFYEATFLFKNNVSPRIATTALGFVNVGLVQPDPGAAALEIYNIVTGSGHMFSAGVMIDDWSILGCHVAQGTPTGDLLGEHNETRNGTLVDNAITSNCSALVNKSTALGGRQFRGRMFIPPIWLNEGAVDAAGNIFGSVVTTIQGTINTTLIALAVADWQPQLFHQGLTPPAPTPIGALTLQSLIATQRRRMRS
jgi:hypothetical protein